jgi:hypothetical protein
MLSLALTTPVRAQDTAIAFTNAVIETAGIVGRIENGTLILRGGKIEAVGTGIKIPDDARVIDARGQTIMPGIIDPFREVTIAGAAPETEQRPIIVRGRNFPRQDRPALGATPFTRVADNFYPYDPSYQAWLRTGQTGLNLVTSGYGQSAVVRVTPKQSDTMMVNLDGFLFTSVTNDTTSLDIVRTALEMIDRRKKGLPAVTPPSAPPTAEAPSGPPPGRRGGGRRGGGGMPGRAPGGGGFDPLSLKAWQDVYEGKTPLFANAANAAGIVHLLKAVEPYKDVKLIVTASSPALYETIHWLNGHQVRVIIKPGLSLKPNTRDRVDVANLLHEARLEFAFTHPANASDLQAAQDFPLFPVAYLVKCGLPRKVAIEALTARPAAMLGVNKTHGAIEPGKSADLLVFQGDPLDPMSQLRQVLIEGRTVYEN